MTQTITPALGYESIQTALEYLDAAGVDVPPDLRLRAKRLMAVKAAGLDEISALYHNEITEALVTFFERTGNVVGPRNRFRVATTDAFYDAFYLGWTDGGGAPPPDSEAMSWLQARLSAEYGYIDMLFEEARELRREADFDWFAWVSARADGYVRTLKEIYNAAFARSSKDIMVTFDGDDGAESCDDCQHYKGQRHKLSWFVRRNAIPPFGRGLECHKGGRCQHYLVDDKGNQVTA